MTSFSWPISGLLMIAVCLVQKVDEAIASGTQESSFKGTVVEDDPEYQLIVDCNTLSVDIDNEITVIHNFIRDKYRAKFPELESLVLHPIDYSRLVKQIGNEMDLTLVDLGGLLPCPLLQLWRYLSQLLQQAESLSQRRT